VVIGVQTENAIGTELKTPEHNLCGGTGNEPLSLFYNSQGHFF
jgi:hypothetical protein